MVFIIHELYDEVPAVDILVHKKIQDGKRSQNLMMLNQMGAKGQYFSYILVKTSQEFATSYESAINL